LIPLFNGFDPLAFLKQSTQSPQKTQNYYRPTETSQEADIEMEELSDQLSSILLKEEQILLNKTGRAPNQKPRWPITTTRDKHGDNDVFLARANNPFGHSTKWKYK
jgi:iron-sulfur cluster repair protein YtfE (RIC family)